MRKLMMAVAAVAGLAVVGCQKGSGVQSEVRDVSEAQQELQQKQQEVAQGGAGATQDAQQQVAEAREEVRKEQQELGEARAEEESQLAEGGSGTAGTTGTTAGATTDTMASATTVQGSIQSAKKDSLVLSVPGQANGQLRLKTDAQTRVMQNNKSVKLDDLKEGAQVRASYVSQGNDMVARDITVLSPATTPNNMNQQK
jgi:hypothetical protein